ncbi:hypothetical protein F4679DRAFT_275976 [Xylaria curta]|nr:hypothetical protein F4679DRAFT_275976 [Xylaria curta]
MNTYVWFHTQFEPAASIFTPFLLSLIHQSDAREPAAFSNGYLCFLSSSASNSIVWRRQQRLRGLNYNLLFAPRAVRLPVMVRVEGLVSWVTQAPSPIEARRRARRQISVSYSRKVDRGKDIALLDKMVRGVWALAHKLYLFRLRFGVSSTLYS